MLGACSRACWELARSLLSTDALVTLSAYPPGRWAACCRTRLRWAACCAPLCLAAGAARACPGSLLGGYWEPAGERCSELAGSLAGSLLVSRRCGWGPPAKACCWDACWDFCWEPAGCLLGACWELAGSLRGACWEPAGSLLVGLLGDCWQPAWDFAECLLGACWEPAGSQIQCISPESLNGWIPTPQASLAACLAPNCWEPTSDYPPVIGYCNRILLGSCNHARKPEC